MKRTVVSGATEEGRGGNTQLEQEAAWDTCRWVMVGTEEVRDMLPRKGPEWEQPPQVECLG